MDVVRVWLKPLNHVKSSCYFSFFLGIATFFTSFLLQALHIVTVPQRRLRFWAHNSWCHSPIVSVVSIISIRVPIVITIGIRVIKMTKRRCVEDRNFCEQVWDREVQWQKNLGLWQKRVRVLLVQQDLHKTLQRKSAKSTICQMRIGRSLIWKQQARSNYVLQTRACTTWWPKKWL